MNKTNNKRNNKKPGFTLVEMVVVVTILGILSSLGFMKFGQAQQSAKLNADYVAASSLATATKLALQDKVIDSTTQTIEVSVLKNYLSTIPKPQSINGEGAKFIITIGDEEDITVKIPKQDENGNAGTMQLYPKID